MKLRFLLLIAKVFAKKCPVISANISSLTPTLFASFNDGIPCENQSVPEGTLPVSINPSIFGITQEIWTNEIVNTRNFSWCGKALKIKANNKEFLLTVTHFCPLERFEFSISSSNGAKKGEKCFFDNSINLLDQEALLQQISPENPYFPEPGEVILEFL
jgi:hypothetical protein